MSTFCTNCGNGLTSDTKFCPNCGVAVSPAEPSGNGWRTAIATQANNTLTSHTAVATTQENQDHRSNVRISSVDLTATIQRANGLMSNSTLFVLTYVLLLLPTYFLPYLGSNSAVINSAAAASGAGLSPLFLLHAAALLLLIATAWARGNAISKSSLPGLSFAAALFDLLPGLNLIPMIPTLFHLLVIIFGLQNNGRQ